MIKMMKRRQASLSRYKGGEIFARRFCGEERLKLRELSKGDNKKERKKQEQKLKKRRNEEQNEVMKKGRKKQRMQQKKKSNNERN